MLQTEQKSWLSNLTSMLDICLQSNTDHARLFIERVVAYAGCDIASKQFRSDVIDRLKKAAKVCTANASGMLPEASPGFHREACITHLFALGIGENDSSIVRKITFNPRGCADIFALASTNYCFILLHGQVIERCEDLLSKCKDESSTKVAVTRAELLSSMESLLKVTKKLLEESKNT